MNLGETVIHQSLKSVFMWEHLCVEIGVLVGFEELKFMQCVGIRLPFCFMAAVTLSETMSTPQLLKGKP